jgi:hypothetical protein
MPGRSSGKGEHRQGASTKDGASELLELVIAYAKQETVDPVVRQLKALGRGIAGAVLLAMGTVLLGLGFLRALQTEFGGARGDQSGYRTIYATSAALHSGVVMPVSRAVRLGAFGIGAHLSGDWSWVPYMGGALFCIAVAALCATRITRGGR